MNKEIFLLLRSIWAGRNIIYYLVQPLHFTIKRSKGTKEPTWPRALGNCHRFLHQEVFCLVICNDFEGFLLYPTDEKSTCPQSRVTISFSVNPFLCLPLGSHKPSIPLWQHLSQSALNFTENSAVLSTWFWALWGHRRPLIYQPILSTYW